MSEHPRARYPDLAGRTILVTGGNSGIGLACVRGLLEQGAFVGAADVRLDALQTLADGLPGEHAALLAATAVDVTDENAVAEWVEAMSARYGAVSGLVISAGIEPAEDAATHLLDAQTWSRTMDVNLGGAFIAGKHVVGAMLRDATPGSIVFIGSPTGFYGFELGHHAYSASKGGMLGLARVMAAEYAARSIRVNAVWPGLIETPMNSFLLDDPAALAREVAAIPQKRMGQPAEVAAMVQFLLSDVSAYCSGGIFTVDGGLTAV